MLGKPLLGGQIYDTLRALDYLRSRPDVAAPVSLVGDGPHGVIALYAAALDVRIRGVALRQIVTDYRSLAAAERYTQPFGIYAYGILRLGFFLLVAAAGLAQRRGTSPTTSSGSASDTTARIVAAAQAFLTSLDDAGRAKVQFRFDDAAQKTRWSNLPSPMFERKGIR